MSKRKRKYQKSGGKTRKDIEEKEQKREVIEANRIATEDDLREEKYEDGAENTELGMTNFVVNKSGMCWTPI